MDRGLLLTARDSWCIEAPFMRLTSANSIMIIAIIIGSLSGQG